MMTRRDILKTAAALTAAGPMPARAASRGARSHGFHYPEESQPHERTFMQWPVSRRVYSSLGDLDMMQQTIADIANTIAAFEPVVILMDADHAGTARRQLGENVEIWDIPTEDLWARDSGPAFVINNNGGLALAHFNFNGWGGKQVHRKDGQIARRVAEHMGLDLFDVGLVGEPGGAEFDGEGTVIAHESSWINPNRNPESKVEVEHMLLENYGAEKVIWAPGIKGQDITDYHIDALARFITSGTVLIQIAEGIDPSDPWSRAAFETYEILCAATDAKGRPLDLVTLPDPLNIRALSYDFVASYVNYYVCNGAVITSEFGDRNADEHARSVLSELYPDREVVMLNTDPVGAFGGGIHCATQQQPKL